LALAKLPCKIDARSAVGSFEAYYREVPSTRVSANSGTAATAAGQLDSHQGSRSLRPHRRVDGSPPKRIVVTMFDSMEKAKDWRASEAYKTLIPIWIRY